MELIDRQATLEKINTLCKAYALHEPVGRGGLPAAQKCREIVEKQPTIEPECGEWVETEPDEDDRKIGMVISIKCSRCHDENSHLDFNENHEITGKTFWKSRFCPNCGAYMRKASENANGVFPIS